jgi:hypothetical protein
MICLRIIQGLPTASVRFQPRRLAAGFFGYDFLRAAMAGALPHFRAFSLPLRLAGQI